MIIYKKRTITLCYTFLISLTIFACYFPTRNFSFVNFDDDQYVTTNSFVQDGFTLPGVIQALHDTSTGHWHPVTWFSYMLDVELFGIDPAAMHLVNAGLHALSAGVLFLALFAMTGQVGRAATVALLFGLHPMRIESVAWISQRKDVLSLFLGLTAILIYVCWISKHRRSTLAVVSLTFVFALLAKPTLITLPIILLCLDYWPLRRISRASVIEKLPLFLIVGAFSIAVIYAQHAGAGLRDTAEVALGDRFSGAMVGFLAYFGKLFFPSGFGVFYPLTQYAPGIGAGCFFGVAALTAWFFRHSSIHPYLAMGWVWFVISLIPVIGFIQVGGQTFADRWTYLPHIGLLIAAVWYGAELLQKSGRFSKFLQPGVAFAACAICIIITTRTLPHWRDSEALFAHTLVVSPNNFMAHTNLGATLDAQGRLDEAALHFEEAVRLNPTYPEALNNLGTLRARQNKLPEARELFEKALGIRPTFSRARHHLGLAQHALGSPLLAAREWVSVLIADQTFKPAKDSLRFSLQNNTLPTCAIINTANRNSRLSLSQALQQWQPSASDQYIKESLRRIAECG